MWVAVIIGYHVVSRLAYVGGVGTALTAQDRHQSFTRRYGVEQGFRRFRSLAGPVMNNDAVSFVLLCLVTRETMFPDMPLALRLGGGLLLIVLGIGSKVWAARSLGSKGYYWHNFFAPGDPAAPSPGGPYRYLRNPMYTVGYLHAYGAALLCASWPGLVAAVFDQTAILLFNQIVEKPHFERVSLGTVRKSL